MRNLVTILEAHAPREDQVAASKVENALHKIRAFDISSIMVFCERSCEDDGQSSRGSLLCASMTGCGKVV